MSLSPLAPFAASLLHLSRHLSRVSLALSTTSFANTLLCPRTSLAPLTHLSLYVSHCHSPYCCQLSRLSSCLAVLLALPFIRFSRHSRSVCLVATFFCTSPLLLCLSGVSLPSLHVLPKIVLISHVSAVSLRASQRLCQRLLHCVCVLSSCAPLSTPPL